MKKEKKRENKIQKRRREKRKSGLQKEIEDSF